MLEVYTALPTLDSVLNNNNLWSVYLLTPTVLSLFSLGSDIMSIAVGSGFLLTILVKREKVIES